MRGDNLKALQESVSKNYKIVENIRDYLEEKEKVKITAINIAEELEMSYKTLANFKNRESRNFLIYVTIWCVKNNLDVRDFVKVEK